MAIDLKEYISGTHFTWHDALYLPTFKIHHNPTVVERQAIVDLAYKLDVVYNYFNIPFKITCWLRPKIVQGIENNVYNGQDYNKLKGGAASSQHILGNAVDFLPVGMDLDVFLKQLEPLLPTFKLSAERNGTAVKRLWVHLDGLQRSKQWKMFLP